MIVDNPSEAIQSMAEQLEVIYLKKILTVDNWEKIKMSKQVVKCVNDIDLPPRLCSITKEEYSECLI